MWYRTIAAVIFTLGGFGQMANAGGQPAADSLQQLLTPIKGIQARFTQMEQDQDGEVIEDLSQQGHMQLTRPGNMRWIVEGEFGQQIITNGETLWVYDPDLEQVTIQPVGDGSPVLLLMGDFEKLVATYEITHGSGVDSYNLRPRESNDAYQQLTVTFDNQLPQKIVILNNLGERTLIEFTGIELNPDLDPAQFTFKTPDGVEEILNY